MLQSFAVYKNRNLEFLFTFYSFNTENDTH